MTWVSWEAVAASKVSDGPSFPTDCQRGPSFNLPLPAPSTRLPRLHIQFRSRSHAPAILFRGTPHPTQAMRTPTHVPSARPSSTPRPQARMSQSSPVEVGDRDIPIDPVLLREDGHLGMDDEDAEGEMVDEDADLLTVQPVSTTRQSRSPTDGWPSNQPSDAARLGRSDTTDTLPSRQTPIPHRREQPRASSSRRDHDADSITSSLTPAPPKKRGRPFKTQTPSLQLSHAANGHTTTNGHGKGKGKSQSFPRHATASAGSTVRARAKRDKFCSFCMGTDEQNKYGAKERMVSCGRCGRSGHPSCLNMVTKELCLKIMTYDWCCMECKTCEVCMIKGDDVRELSIYGHLRRTDGISTG